MAVTKFTRSPYDNPPHALLNIHNIRRAVRRLLRPHGVLVVRSSLLAKWLRKWVIGIG